MDVFLEQIWSTACGAAKCCHGLLQTLVAVGRSWGSVGRSSCRSLASVFPGLVIDSVRVKGSSGGGAGGGRSGWSGSIGCVLALWSLLRAPGQGRLGPLLPGDALLRVDDSVLRFGAGGRGARRELRGAILLGGVGAVAAKSD